MSLGTSKAALLAHDQRQPAMRGSDLLDEYLDRDEAAAALNVCSRTLDRWHIEGIGPRRTILGRKIYYRRDAIRAWLLSREQDPNDFGAE